MFRSLLFVPGNRPERFAKAVASGADAVCIDLEDAVAPADRVQARLNIAAFLRDGRPQQPAIGVRINGLRTPDGVRDVTAIMDWTAPDFVLIAKADFAQDIAVINAAFGGRVPLWPLVESGRAMESVWDIAHAPGVAGIQFGAADYSSDIRCEMVWEPLLYARSRLVVASASAKIGLLDVPHIDIEDHDGLVNSTLRVKALGFTGRSCIHPSHVSTVNKIFSPTADEVEHARAVVDAYENARGGATTLKGTLVERPQLLAAQHVLQRAGLCLEQVPR